MWGREGVDCDVGGQAGTIHETQPGHSFDKYFHKLDNYSSIYKKFFNVSVHVDNHSISNTHLLSVFNCSQNIYIKLMYCNTEYMLHKELSIHTPDWTTAM